MYQERHHRKSTETRDQKLAQRIYDKVKGRIAEKKYFPEMVGENKTFDEMECVGICKMVEKFKKENIPSRSRVPHLANIKTLSRFFWESSFD